MPSLSTVLRGSLVATSFATMMVLPTVRAQQGGTVASPPPRDAGVLARVVRTARPPELDRRLDDPAWAHAPVIAGFVQHEPFEGRPATERTEVRILFDQAALYVGAWLLDANPAGIVQGEARRGVALHDMDALLVVFDTYLDRQNAFVFGTTPAGIEYEDQITKEGEGGFNGDFVEPEQA